MKLDELKKASPQNKTRYAFIVAVSTTLVITAIWVSSLPARFGGVAKNTVEIQTKESSVFNGIGRSIAGFFGEIKNDVINNAAIIDSETDLMDSEPNLETDDAYFNLQEFDETNQDAREETEREDTTSITESSVSIENSQNKVMEEQESPVKVQEPRIIMIGTTTQKTTQ